jgi:hypothetical protein
VEEDATTAMPNLLMVWMKPTINQMSMSNIKA